MGTGLFIWWDSIYFFGVYFGCTYISLLPSFADTFKGTIYNSSFEYSQFQPFWEMLSSSLVRTVGH